MWCHVLLSMPVLGLGLFLVLPVAPALSIYLILVLISLWLYRVIMRSTAVPVRTGPEALVNQIVNTDACGAVHWHGEWWTAEPHLPLQRVRIVGLRGLNLVVQPCAHDTRGVQVDPGTISSGRSRV